MPKTKAPVGASPAVPALRYVGDGRWLRGVPARDLSAEEIEQRGLDSGALIRSGLYTEAASATAADEQSADSGKE
jgi:hypothetical protein